MKIIRLLKVCFDTEIKSYEVEAFRGAVIAKAGNEHVLFHNHTADGFRYSYPLIQYKRIGGKPTIICIEKGVDEIHHFFENKDWKIKISGEEKDLKIQNLNVNQFTMQVWDKNFKYSLKNWLALNSENHKKYIELDGIIEKTQFLQSLLTGNIISFAKGIEWQIDKEVSIKILEITDTKILPYKKQKMQSFDLSFSTNVFLPNFIGIGKGVSMGFGTVLWI